jgi:hypothetical protein
MESTGRSMTPTHEMMSHVAVTKNGSDQPWDVLSFKLDQAFSITHRHHHSASFSKAFAQVRRGKPSPPKLI